MKSTEYQIKNAGGIDIIGIDVVTSNADDKAADDINALWQRFFEDTIGNKIPNRIGDAIYAVYTDYEGDHTKPYRFILGLNVSALDDIPKGMVGHSIPAGRYGQFSSIGEQPRSLINTWESIWEMETLPRAFTSDYEVYGQRFFEPGLHEVLIHIALENIQ